jgi:zinc/manganese transport system substrate-binding protein
MPKAMQRILLAIALLLQSAIGCAQGGPIQVVTSFSILEDLVRELGGAQVRITNLVGRNSDAHMYQPKPSDAKAITRADLVILNGLGFEGWITRLMDLNDYRNARLVASDGVQALMIGDETDPHAWQSFDNIAVYVGNITRALVALRPEHKAEFTQRHAAYLQRVQALQREMLERISAVPPQQRVVVTSHDAFGYLGREFNIQFLAPVGLSTDAEATANDVSGIIREIRRLGVRALFMENINNPRLLEQISAETGISIGGRLYSDALGDIDGPSATYLSMMRHNIESLATALHPGQARPDPSATLSTSRHLQ